MDQFRDKAHLAGEGDSGSVSSAASGEENAGFLYDSRRGELLGRTLPSWLKLVSFYLLYTAILAMLWGLCMGVFFQTLDFYIPKLIEDSRNPGLGFRPAGGLGFKNDKGEDSAPSVYSSLIWFRHGASGNWQQLKVGNNFDSQPYWQSYKLFLQWGRTSKLPKFQVFFQSNLDVFLTQYEPGYFASQGSSLTKCSFENDPLARKQNSLGSGYSGTIDESCEFNKEWLSDQGADYKCISEEDYG